MPKKETDFTSVVFKDEIEFIKYGIFHLSSIQMAFLKKQHLFCFVSKILTLHKILCCFQRMDKDQGYRRFYEASTGIEDDDFYDFEGRHTTLKSYR